MIDHTSSTAVTFTARPARCAARAFTSASVTKVAAAPGMET